ncbi:MAG: hypothetical protein ACOC3T_02160 [Bacteroidota bacterium]
MATEIIVKRNKRKTKRDINKVFSYNFNKILTEIILNSDDSYKRLENQTQDDSVKEIIVDIDRKNKTVKVTDYAEGMTVKEMEEIFSDYGGEHNRNIDGTIRGLFGQGASDVLFFGVQASKLGKIESIKEDKLHVCKFTIASEQTIKVDEVSHRQQVKAFKKKYNIKDVGTVVSFGLGEKVSIPHKNKLKSKIEKFYMLRYVLSDPKRKVIIKHDGVKERLSSAHLLLNEDNKLFEKKLKFKYGDFNLPCTLRLFKDEKNDSDEKILIRDLHKIVYDNTFFGLDELSGANRITGELIIKGIHACLTSYLNSEDPQEILRDSRDGFDQREDFTKKLFGLIKPHVKEQIQQLNAAYEPKQIKMDTDKKLRNMLNKINQYYRDLKLEEIGTFDKGVEPPAEGIKFVRDKIHITQRKTYGLKMLINANMIDKNEEIVIDSDDVHALELGTKAVRISEKDMNEYGLVVKTVVLKGKQVTENPINLTATCLDHVSNTHVNVVEEIIVYPEEGIEFIPKEVRVKPQKNRTLNLYVDTSRFSLGTRINIERISRSELIPESETVVLSKNHLINEDLANIPILFKGGNNGEIHHYTATADNVRTKAMVRVEESKKTDKGLEGLFSGLEGQYDSAGNWQSKHDRNTGKILINLSHPIHKTLLPNVTKETIADKKYTPIEYSYIFELVSIECAKQIAQIKIDKNELKDTFNETYREIQKYKTDLYKTVIEM